MAKEKKQTRYKIVTSIKEVKQLIKCCQQTGYASIDFETSGLEFYEKAQYATVLGISYQVGTAIVIPLYHFESPFSKAEVIEIFKLLNEGIFMNKDIVKIGQNIKFEWKWLFRYNCNLYGRVFDTMLAKYCLDEERPHGLKDMVRLLIPEFANYELGLKGREWSEIPLEELAQYNAIDCDSTLRLMMYFEPILIQKGFYKIFRNMLMMATRVLAESEYRGLLVDRKYLEEQCKDFERQIAEVEFKLRNNRVVKRFERKYKKEIIRKFIQTVQREIEDIEDGESKTKEKLVSNRNTKIQNYLAGNFSKKEQEKVDGGINFASPAQFAYLLYRAPYGFKFPILKFTKDKFKQPTKNPSTDEEALTMLKDRGVDKSGFLDTFLKLRELRNLYNTFLKGVLERLSSSNHIHASFHLLTVTGRLGCKDPNLMNIPRDNTAPVIKKMYVCPPGKVWTEVDYGQSELRLAAEISNDQALIDIFKRGYNVHLASAVKMAGCYERYDEIKALLKNPEHPEFHYWEKQKKKGKVLNFSILYMQSDKQTAAQMGVSLEEAKQFKAEWFAQFPKIKAWIKKQEKFLRKHGYVLSIFGRKRRLPDIWSGVWGFENAAIREAVNFPMQSGSADYTTLSCIMIRKAIIKRELKGLVAQVCTVHDSIEFYSDVDQVHINVEKIVKICENPETFKYFGFEMKKVKMKMSPEVGSNWGTKFDHDPTKDYSKILEVTI